MIVYNFSYLLIMHLLSHRHINFYSIFYFKSFWMRGKLLNGVEKIFFACFDFVNGAAALIGTEMFYWLNCKQNLLAFDTFHEFVLVHFETESELIFDSKCFKITKLLAWNFQLFSNSILKSSNFGFKKTVD